MATMQSAKEKYTRKMATAGARYNESKGRAKANWASGMSRFLGGPVSGTASANYSSGIDAAQYRPGDPDKWERNMRAGLQGG